MAIDVKLVDGIRKITSNAAPVIAAT